MLFLSIFGKEAPVQVMPLRQFSLMSLSVMLQQESNKIMPSPFVNILFFTIHANPLSIAKIPSHLPLEISFFKITQSQDAAPPNAIYALQLPFKTFFSTCAYVDSTSRIPYAKLCSIKLFVIFIEAFSYAQIPVNEFSLNAQFFIMIE